MKKTMKSKLIKATMLVTALAFALAAVVPLGVADDDDPPAILVVREQYIDYADGSLMREANELVEYPWFYSKPVPAILDRVAVAIQIDSDEVIEFPRLPDGSVQPFTLIEFPVEPRTDLFLEYDGLIKYFFKEDKNNNRIPDDEEDDIPLEKVVVAGIFNSLESDSGVVDVGEGDSFEAFHVNAKNFGNIGVARMQISVTESEHVIPGFALQGGLDGGATLHVFEVDPVEAGYKTYNIYIIPDSDYLFVPDGAGLLRVYLTITQEGTYSVDALLGALEVTYYDDGYEGGNKPLQAIATIDAPLAFNTFEASSNIFDIDRDGKLSLVDVEHVRRNIGKNTSSPEWETTPLIRRCDLNGDGKVDIEDLLIILTAYESML